MKAWANVVWTRPSEGSMHCGSLSTYVDFSFVHARYSSIFRTTGWSSTIDCSVLSSVENCPLCVFFVEAGLRPSFV